jgi:hypothetical protein
MSVNVVDVGGTQASFTFTNIGTTASFIGQIYFDTAGVFSGFNTLTNTSGEAGESTGVNFRTGSGNLPSGNTANPAFSADYAFDAVPPPAQNGIDNGTTTVFESLTVFGAYASGQGFSSLLSSFNSGATRIGIHVQGIGQFSESMITVVPVPAALPLMLSGLVGLGFLARRRTRS